VRQNQKDIERFESNGVDGEEIDGDHLSHVVANESPPGLRRWPRPAYHVLGNSGLTDVVPEL